MSLNYSRLYTVQHSQKQVESIHLQSNNAINEQIIQHSQLPQVLQFETSAYMSNLQFAPKAMELTPEPVKGNIRA